MIQHQHLGLLRSGFKGNRLLWLLLLPPLLMSGALYFFTERAYRSADTVGYRRQFVRALDDYLSGLKDAETAQRGYLLTGRPEYLRPYDRALQDLPPLAARLEMLGATPDVHPAVLRIDLLARAKLAEMAQTIELYKTGNTKAAMNLILDDNGKILMDQEREEIAALQKSENAFLNQETARRDSLRAWVNVLLFAVPLLTALMIWGLIVIAQRHARNRDEKQREVEALNDSLELRVRARTAALEAANRNLEDFARAAAHDLKSPVRTASTMVQLAQRRFSGQLPAEGGEMLQSATDSLKRLSALVEDLLAYQRLTLSESPPLQPVELAKPIREAQGSLRALLDETGAQVHVGELPAALGNEGQLTRLFQNLLENSVKYRKPNEPAAIDISAIRNGAHCVVAVRDNGIGFDNQYANLIFQPFQRLDGAAAPGSGLGLALCARIVENCGGRIWADSQPGAGSTFYIELSSTPSTSLDRKQPRAVSNSWSHAPSHMSTKTPAQPAGD